MTSNTIFYYPYSSFKDSQMPLLKAVALYFDKLYILDPAKATFDMIGVGGEFENAIALLEREGLLERIAPEEILDSYEDGITNAIRADLQDAEFVKLCEEQGGGRYWTVALAKVPEQFRDSTMQHIDNTMKHMMNNIPLQVPEQMRPRGHASGTFFYDENLSGKEYRYADYPLPLGESIMVNHALFAGMQYKGATPLTDERFHWQVLNLKIKRASTIPEVQKILEDRVTKQNLLSLKALTDTQLNLPILSPKIHLEDILIYRRHHDSELQQARDRLGWLARQIEQTPWTADFEGELEHETIPELAKAFDEIKQARESWLQSERGKYALEAAGITVTLASTVVSLVLTPTPLLPVALGLAGSVVIPGFQLILERRQGQKETTANGLHYFLDLHPG